MTRRGSSPVFVGRLEELGRLDGTFARAVDGQPSLVLVAGDAGVGKSRLIAEFVGHAQTAGAHVAVGGCLDVGAGGLPYAPFVEAFRGLARQLDAAERDTAFGGSTDVFGLLTPPGRGPLQAGVIEPVDPSGRLARLFESVLGTLGRAAADRPLVLVIEDLHWADGSTRDLLRFVVRNMRSERLVLVATYRSDDLHRRHPLRPLLAELDRAERVERIELAAFDRDEMREQLAGILGRRPEAAMVDVLLERSDGLPFYVEELIAGGRTGAELPSTLRDILGSRLETLSPRARSVVRAAAVVGGRFPHDRLAAASGEGEDALTAGLDEAIDAGIVVSIDDGGDPAYAFRHALLREAAYEDLLPAERVRMHSRLVDHLQAAAESGSPPDPRVVAEYALHAYQAHDQARALVGSVRAVEALAAATAYREALGHAERAIELWPRVDDASGRTGIAYVDLLALAARIASATNERARATALLHAALLEDRVDTDPERRAELLATLHEVAWEAEDFDASAAAAEEAYALVEHAAPSRAKSLALLALGLRRWWTGRLRSSLELLEASAAVSEAIGDRSGREAAMAAAAHTLADLGWVVRAADYVDRSMEPDGPIDDRLESILADVDRSQVFWSFGRFDDAARAAETGLARATRFGWEPRRGSEFRGCIADACFELGRYDDVEQVTRPGIAGDGIPHTISWAALTMARADVARGRLGHAHRLMDDLAPATMAGSYYQLSMIELARADGRFDAVVDGVASAVASCVRSERVMPLPMILGAAVGAAADAGVAAQRRRKTGEIAAVTGHAAAWLQQFRDLVRGAEAEGGPGPFIEALLASAEAEATRLSVGSDPVAWRDAVERWSRIEQPQQRAYATLRLGEAVLDSGGDRDEARSLLESAIAVATMIGAEPVVQEARSIGRRARLPIEGVDAPVIPGPDVAVATLTGRERDVIRLVAAGHTNREIGDRLFISEKTVSVHVSNAMAKLGALSRYEAAALAERQGLL